MFRRGMKPVGLVTLGVLYLLLFSCGQVFAWGSGAHAWVADRLGESRPMTNLNEIYGINAPDSFNYLFSHPDWRSYLYDETHTNFRKVWQLADGPWGKAAALGFVAHNGEWGCDRTAHYDGLTFGQGEGYVIAKAKALMLRLPLYYVTQGQIALSPEIELELHHNFIESAVDLLLGQQERTLGSKLAVAALTRTPELPRTMSEVYAPRLSREFGLTLADARGVITANEAEFRKTMVLYGTMLGQEPATALQLMAEQLADLAPQFLQTVPGPTLPPREALVSLATFYLAEAMNECRGDFLTELEATAEFVARQLRRHGVRY